MLCSAVPSCRRKAPARLNSTHQGRTHGRSTSAIHISIPHVFQEREPLIHRAVRFGAVLENVCFDEVRSAEHSVAAGVLAAGWPCCVYRLPTCTHRTADCCCATSGEHS